MPIPVFTTVEPPVDTGADVITVIRKTPTVILTDSTGAQVTLGDDGEVILGPGSQGMGLAPTALFANTLPDDDGSMFRALRLTERDVFFPVMLCSTSYEGLRDLRRSLERLIDPKRGAVTITVAQPDGEHRHATGYYVGGMEGDYARNVFGVEWQVLGLTFRCFDPYWYADPVTLTFTTPASGRPFLDTISTFFPVQLSASQVIGTVTVDNPGDSATYPTWTALGPGSGFTASNDTSGESFEITGAIAGGDSVVIDTRRSVQTVADQDGVNLWARLVAGSSLWALQPGVQTVSIVMGSSTVASLATLTFQPRYRSAV